MGRSSGTGQPNWFGCTQCRKHWYTYSRTNGAYGHRHGHVDEVTLTGRVRKVPAGRGGQRVTFTRYEYRCEHCGHVGWSRHIDLAYKADHVGVSPHPLDHSGLERYRKAQTKKQNPP